MQPAMIAAMFDADELIFAGILVGSVVLPAGLAALAWLLAAPFRPLPEAPSSPSGPWGAAADTPRSYRAEGFVGGRYGLWALYTLGPGGLLVVIGAAMALTGGPLPRAVSLALTVAAATAAVAAAGRLVSIFHTVVILEPDAIAWRGVLSRRRLARANIAGWRTYSLSGDAPVIRLRPGRKGEPDLRFSVYWPVDEAFAAWFDGLPGLDELEQRAMEAGSAPAVMRLAVLAWPLNLAGCALLIGNAVSGLLGPGLRAAYLAACIAAVTLAIGLVAASRGRWTFLLPGHRPGVLLLALGPAVALLPLVAGLPAADDRGQTLIWSLVLAVLITSLMVFLDRRALGLPSRIAATAALALIFAWSGLKEANVLFDTRPPSKEPVEAYALVADSATASKLAEQAPPDGFACVAVHPGLFGWAWTEAGLCPPPPVIPRPPAGATPDGRLRP